MKKSFERKKKTSKKPSMKNTLILRGGEESICSMTMKKKLSNIIL